MRVVFERSGPLLVLRLCAVRPEKQKYLTSKDVAEMLDLSRDTIYRLVRKRSLKGYRIGAMLRFHLDDVRQFLYMRSTNRAQGRQEG